jgi:hypothetical protein
LSRLKSRFIGSALNLAAWINLLGSEERRNPYRCPVCGSTEIHMRAWIAPNRGGRYVEDIIDDGADDDWCQNCEQAIHARPTDELLADAAKWWGGIDFREMERTTGYRQFDYDPEDGCQAFVDACNGWWSGKTAEEKIGIWFNRLSGNSEMSNTYVLVEFPEDASTTPI